MASTEMAPTLGQTRSLWERVYPRRMQRGAWHRLRRCSRVNPLPHRPVQAFTILGQGHGLYWNGANPEPGAIPVGAGLPANNATRCMAPATPVIAGTPAPTSTRAGFTILGQGHGLYWNGANPEPGANPVGAGLPAKNATRCVAPATPVFAGEPAPTGTAHVSKN